MDIQTSIEIYIAIKVIQTSERNLFANYIGNMINFNYLTFHFISYIIKLDFKDLRIYFD